MKKLIGIIMVLIVMAIIGNSVEDSSDYSSGYTDSYGTVEDAGYNDSTCDTADEGYTYEYTSEGLSEASYEYESDYESNYETSEYSDYSTYNDTAPVSEALFEASDITGRWTDSPGSEIGMFLDITCSGSQLTYDYYQIQRGNSNFVNLNNETTKWEYCNGDVIMQANHGSFMCMRGSDSECYVSFYYIDSNTICHQESGEYFYRVY